MSEYQYNHGFIVMRAQPFHKGHKSLIDKMLRECKNITIIIGSTQEERTQKNPFTFDERLQMLKNVYKDNGKFHKAIIFGLDDIPDDNKWYDYVIKHLKEKCSDFGVAKAYYCGDDDDGHWFNDGEISIEKIERTAQEGEKLISATSIRKMINENNPNWKKYIPEENIEYLEGLIKTL
jgi:nicotinamide-nucleotide adenylyltransferase